MFSLLKTLPALNKLPVSAINLSPATRTVRTRKAPWIPRAKSKAFRVPPMPVVDMEEKIFMESTYRHWRAQMRSMYALLKTEAKFSDKASLIAQETKRKVMEQEKLLIEQNNVRNASILAEQLADIDTSLAERKLLIEQQVKEKLEQEMMLVQVADGKVRALKEKAKGFIDPQNLEYEIEKMLNERHSYDFAINSNGQFIRESKVVSKAEALNTRYVAEKEQPNQPESV